MKLTLRFTGKILLALTISMLGLAATVSAKDVTLNWNPNQEPDVAGYKVYYGSSGNMLNGADALEGPSPIDVSSAVTATLSGLDDTQPHCFKVTAYNLLGQESGYSNEVCSQAASPTGCTDQDGDGLAVEGGACGLVDLNDQDPAVTSAPPAGSIEAEWATLTGPMQQVADSSTSGGYYIQTNTASSGTAEFTFTITTEGVYQLMGRVYAESLSADSFFVSFNGEPEFIWDLNPAALAGEFNTWREDSATNRGNGTATAPQFDPYTLNLAPGVYSVTIRGREAGSRLDYLYLKRVGNIVSPDQENVDADLDGYTLAFDCDDNDPMVNPSAQEITGNGVDENCNGMTDDAPVVSNPLQPIPQQGWQLLYADSEELVGENGAAQNAFDGNPNTIWHTRWSTANDPIPHEIQIDLGSVFEIGGFSYLPRQDGLFNGNIGTYELYISNDGSGWGTPVAAGIFTGDSQAQEVLFTARNARYVRFRALTETNGNPWTAVSEFNILSANPSGAEPTPVCTDADGDGFATEEGTCGPRDCDDNDSGINPGAQEIPYNTQDENCNGIADDDDLDRDGFGISEDCNDNDAKINPNAEEIPYNNADENCNGMTDDDDLDRDGYGTIEDCNDNDAKINPNAEEIPYNNADENCNGMTDDDDLDRDGYGITEDCNDNDAKINPNAEEIPYNNTDENCNGMADDDDLDSDGYGISQDCDDTARSIYPGASEVLNNGLDENCNGMTDDAPSAPEALLSIPQSNWQLKYTDSEELVGENGAAKNAFDGDPNTIWHTAWANGNAPIPHEIQIDLGANYQVEGFRYLPRQDGNMNGTVAQYDFFVSADGTTWGTAVASGTFNRDKTKKEVLFPPKNVRYIRFQAKSEIYNNPWTSMAELEVLSTLSLPVPPSATLTAISQTNWALKYVDSEELVGENGAAINAFDGDPNTIWHTRWTESNDPIPHEIQLDLGGTHTIGGFRYLPRQDGEINGTIGKYEFYVSTDGESWGLPIANGIFTNSTKEKEVLFPHQNARYIRLKVIEEINGKSWTSMAEIKILEP